MNIVLITSVINTSSNRLSYSKTRSKFSTLERYTQTQKTIESVRQKLPNCKLFIIESSILPDEYTEYLIANTDYYLNLNNNPELLENINGQSKSLGEGTQTIHALKYLIDHSIEYRNLIKISGRYFLSDTFDPTIFENNSTVVKTINGKKNNILTAMYKIPCGIVSQLHHFLVTHIKQMKQCIGYEVLFGTFISSLHQNTVVYLNHIGVCGLVSVCGSHYDG